MSDARTEGKKAEKDLTARLGHYLNTSSIVSRMNYKGIDGLGITALMKAASEKKLNILKCLISDARVEVNAQDAEGQTALMYILKHDGHSSKKDADFVKEAFEALKRRNELNVNLATNNGFTTLMSALYYHHPYIAQELIQRPGADVNAVYGKGYTALHTAVRRALPKDTWILDVLISAGANIYAVTTDNVSVLQTACCNKDNPEAAFMLLSYFEENRIAEIEAELSPNYSIHKVVVRYTAALLEIQCSIESEAKRLQEEGIEKDSAAPILCKNTRYPLWYQKKIIKDVKSILEQVYAPILSLRTEFAAKKECRESSAQLIAAVQNKKEKEVAELLNYSNINLNIRDDYGRTPLILAADFTTKGIFKRLVEDSRTNVNIQDYSKYNALSHILSTPLGVRDNGRSAHALELVQILSKRKELDFELKSGSGHQAALMFALNYGYYNVARYLITEKHVNPNTKDYYGKSPLHFMIKNGNSIMRVLVMLIRAGADINALDDKGVSVLSYAVSYGSTHTRFLLFSKLSDRYILASQTKNDTLKNDLLEYSKEVREIQEGTKQSAIKLKGEGLTKEEVISKLSEEDLYPMWYCLRVEGDVQLLVEKLFSDASHSGDADTAYQLSDNKTLLPLLAAQKIKKDPEKEEESKVPKITEELGKLALSDSPHDEADKLKIHL